MLGWDGECRGGEHRDRCDRDECKQVMLFHIPLDDEVINVGLVVRAFDSVGRRVSSWDGRRRNLQPDIDILLPSRKGRVEIGSERQRRAIGRVGRKCRSEGIGGDLHIPVRSDASESSELRPVIESYPKLILDS